MDLAPDGPGEERGCSEQLCPHLGAARLNDDGDDACRRSVGDDDAASVVGWHQRPPGPRR